MDHEIYNKQQRRYDGDRKYVMYRQKMEFIH